MERDDPVRLTVGERHEVVLPGLGTAGYVWSWDSDPAAPVAVEKTLREPPGSLPTAAGGSADEVFVVTATRPGSGRVRFVQRRPWEAAAAPQNEFVLDVLVEP